MVLAGRGPQPRDAPATSAGPSPPVWGTPTAPPPSPGAPPAGETSAGRSGAGRSGEAGVGRSGTSAGGEITVYYTAVEEYHHGEPERVTGCPRLTCSHGHDDLGTYPAGFVAAVRSEGTGR